LMRTCCLADECNVLPATMYMEQGILICLGSIMQVVHFASPVIINRSKLLEICIFEGRATAPFLFLISKM